MLTPFVRYGHYSFSICHTTNIKIHKKGERDPIIFVGEKGKLLVHQIVEGDYLFAFRKDGMIIQWDYKEQTEIIKLKQLL